MHTTTMPREGEAFHAWGREHYSTEDILADIGARCPEADDEDPLACLDGLILDPENAPVHVVLAKALPGFKLRFPHSPLLQAAYETCVLRDAERAAAAAKKCGNLDPREEALEPRQ